jgi:hypothetical protein
MGVFAFPFMFPVRQFARYYSALAQPRSASALLVVLIDYSIIRFLYQPYRTIMPYKRRKVKPKKPNRINNLRSYLKRSLFSVRRENTNGTLGCFILPKECLGVANHAWKLLQ